MALVLSVFLFFSRVFAVGGINPDWPLLFFSWLGGLSSRKKLHFWSFLFLAFSFLVLSFLISSFWAESYLLLFVIFLSFFYLGRTLTGNWFSDFLIFQIAGSVVFYLISYFVFKTPFSISFVFYEIFYDALISTIFWPVLKKIS